MSQKDSTSSSSNGAAASSSSSQQQQAADMAQAFRDLARGEQQAAALEANLTSLENKLDALLAQFENGAGANNGLPPGEDKTKESVKKE